MSENEKPMIAAATVLLLRAGTSGLEVFMVVRHHEIDSFSGALVFPGGKVDAADWRARALSDGAEELSERAHAFRVGAVREAFEECGVLLAHAVGENTILPAPRVAELESIYRAPILRSETTMAEMCAAEGIRLAVDHLQPFAHWITPNVAPKIFDTYFYLAVAQKDQVALHDGEESTDSLWIKPAEAVAAADEGSHTVVFPTRMNLLKLARAASPADAMARARASRIVTVCPEVSQDDEGRILRIPGDAGYDGEAFRVGGGGAQVERIA